jgi:hypothetical protein
MTAPVWTTPAGFLGTLTERKTTATNLVASGTGLSYSVVSGRLPVGLYLNTSTGVVLGTPVSVATDTPSTFVIRAANTDGVRDRTFSYTVTGTDAPVWATNSGSLPVGMNGEQFTFNKAYVDYQLHADTDILTAGNQLKYYIADNQGQLPPGLKLSTDGRITGYIDDYLLIDAGASIAGGYDTETYDFYPYDHGVVEQNLTTSTYYVEKYNVSFVTNESPARVITTTPHNIFDKNQVTIVDVGTTNVSNNVHEVNNTSTYNLVQSEYYSTSTSIYTTSSFYFTKVISNTSIGLYRDVNLTIPVDLSASTEVYNTGTGVVLWGTQSFINPKSVNKVYQFYVTVTDGIASSQRLFRIEVADPNTFRTDNTLISVDSNIYDADAGYLLAPIWQSKYGVKLPQTANLGSVRAGKPQVFSLYEYDPYPLQGPSYYDWNTVKVNPDIKVYADSQISPSFRPTKNLINQNTFYFKDAEVIPVKGMKIQFSESLPSVDATVYTVVNVIKTSETSGVINLDQPLRQTIPDSRIVYVGTESKHPPGITLNPENGTLYGQVPYQPSYSNGYRFTVKLVKIDQESEGGTTLIEAIGTEDARIVGKVFYEVNTSSVALLPQDLPLQPSTVPSGNRLPTPLEYSGTIGDILLVSLPQNVTNDQFLPLMDGTTYAYVYNPSQYTFTQYSANTASTELLLVSSGITPQEGWVVRRGNINSTIVSVTDNGVSVTLELSNPIPASSNVPESSWTLVDPSFQCWTYLGETVASNQIYLLNVLGEIPSTINFVSSSSLGTLSSGEISEIFVKAENTNTNYAIQYEIIQGQLPPGLTLNLDGTVSGKITSTGQTYFDFTSTTTTALTIDEGSTTVDQNWYFTIRASDVYRLSAVEKEFYIGVYKDTVTDYTRIYVRPFLSAKHRMAYKDFVTNPIIFDPLLIYRPNDPEFGIQQQIRLMIETGIEQTNLNNYAQAMQDYFYRKKFYFGEVKSIMAQDTNGNNVYEIIYVDILDNQMSGVASPSYSVSVKNMQKSLEEIILESGSTITVNERLQPRFMTTLNSDTGVPLGFVKAMPICYTIPGGSTKILSRLANALSTGAWDFKQIHFDTDRIVVETTQETGQTGWLLYPTDRR